MTSLAWMFVLRLYPRRFRERWGDELRSVAAETVHATRELGGGPAFRASVWLLLDALRSAPGAWREDRAWRAAHSHERSAWRDGEPAGERHDGGLVAGGGARPPRHGGGGRLIDAIRQDTRFTLGMWRRSRWFTGFALGTLALGMGAMIAIFSVANAVLLRPMPYSSPERLVFVAPTRAPLTFGAWDELQNARTVSALARWAGWRAGFREGDGAVGVRHSATVSTNFFTMLGTQPHLGRLFLAADDPTALQDAVVLAWGAWQADFGGRPDIIGHRFETDGTMWTVIGVAPREFLDPLGFPINNIETSMYRLWQDPPPERRTATSPLAHLLLAQLSSGATVDQALDELRAIEQRTPARPEAFAESNISAITDLHLDGVKPTLLLLSAAVSLLLLIGCANAANLLLSRATVRRSELALRGALGAGRGRLIGQLLTESLLLALVAGLIGTWLGHVGARGIVQFAGDVIPRGDAVRMDLSVVLFTFALASITAVLFGSAPALQWTRTGPGEALRSGARGAAGAAAGKRLRGVLVIAETALAVVLTFGAALLGTSLWKLQNVDPGYDATNVLTVRATITPARYSPEARVLLHDRIVESIRGLPEVTHAAAISLHPLSGGRAPTPVAREDVELDPASSPRADLRTITADYFESMGMRILAGRALADTDGAGGERVAVVNQALARLLYPDEDPLGRVVQLGAGHFRVVGVAEDVKEFTLAGGGDPFVYITYGQAPPQALPATSTIIVRTRGNAESVVQPVRAAIRDIDATIPVAFLRTMREMMDIDLHGPRLRTLLIGLIGTLAALLAAVGLAGVMAYTVSQSIPEIGVRMALGAQERDVAQLVMGQALRLTLVGLALGVFGALAASRFLTGLLYGITPGDPKVLVLVSLAALVLAAVASGYPALRATRVSPATVLRGL
jgi:putative ABC transport system permease protein